MASFLLSLGLFAASATNVMASCAYGTHLSPRAEEGGAVKVNTFGYAGAIVCIFSTDERQPQPMFYTVWR
jgi:hypothetical protein